MPAILSRAAKLAASLQSWGPEREVEVQVCLVFRPLRMTASLVGERAGDTAAVNAQTHSPIHPSTHPHMPT